MRLRQVRYATANLYIEDALGSDEIYRALRDWVGFDSGTPYPAYRTEEAKALFGFLYAEWFRQTFKFKMDLAALPDSDFEPNPYFSDGLFYRVRFRPGALQELRLTIYGEYRDEFETFLATLVERHKANEMRHERFCLATYGACRGNPDARGEALLAFLAQLSAPLWWEWFDGHQEAFAARYNLKERRRLEKTGREFLWEKREIKFGGYRYIYIPDAIPLPYIDEF
ncbi:hypothetical protein V9W64_10670 [Neisseria leonii]|uniref:Uncharacterized protein n=1 Tax=Neisseria leonii TaxID=2995413 RepID=A0A9X4E4T0_9NEIS|nr:hypothetical protein [Neisseria sp. 51.81]MDD9328785.1 hypothetical protein [Neisseria sp. 51.81]